MEGWLLHEKRTMMRRHVWKLRYFVILRGYALRRQIYPARTSINLAHVRLSNAERLLAPCRKLQWFKKAEDYFEGTKKPLGVLNVRCSSIWSEGEPEVEADRIHKFMYVCCAILEAARVFRPLRSD